MTLLDLDAARPAADLPQPQRTRWQPLRAGLVDLFHYDYEEFHFRDGHLLLRGNNGTGKSKVLALMLPLLLDGDLAPHRVEPDGDPGKRMEWNLLLGGRYPERTGYTWCEFGRIEDGVPRFTTVGIGLRAVQGRPVHSWFFVTDQRVGHDLFLVSAGRSPLRKDALVEAVGQRGVVVEQAERYRRAVNEALFDLAPERYDALLALLVQLRQPALSKRPDERRLSAALTEALPPLDPGVIADLAESFRSLEQERAALLDLQSAQTTAAGFLSTYAGYARVLARRVAAGPRTAQSRYEETGRRLAEVRAELSRATAAEEQVAVRLTELGTEQEQTRRAEQVLRTSKQMQSAAELERLHAEASRAKADAERATGELSQAERELARRVAQHQQAAVELAAAAADAAEARAAADAAAGSARLPAPQEPAAAQEGLHRQREAVRHVRRLVEVADRAAQAVAVAEQARDRAAAERDRAAEAVDAAGEAATAAGEQLVLAARRVVAGFGELRLPDPEGTLDRLRLWAETLHGEQPLAADVQAAARTALEALARDDAGLAAEQQALADRRAGLDDERGRLERGEEVAPAPAPNRDVAGRADRAGAPLWRVVEFADGLPDADRAGLEAALEGSGLLDAWVTPEGRLLDADDAVVLADAPVASSLAAALRPAVDRAEPRAAHLSDDAVQRLLQSIGLGDGSGQTWVETSGRYRAGALHGRWRKSAAQFVGAGARDAARRARLAQVLTELELLAGELARVAAGRARVADRRRAVELDLAALPDDRPLRDAVATVRSALSGLQRAADLLAEAGTTADRAAARAAETAHERDRDAAATGLPAELAGLDAVADALATYGAALAALWPAQARQRRAGELAEAAAAEVAAATATVSRRIERRDATRLESDGAAAAAAELAATVGAAVADVQRRLHEVVAQGRALAAEGKRLGDQRLQLRDAVGAARGQQGELEQKLAQDGGDRDGAVESLRAFAATGLLAAALPELDIPDPAQRWAPTPAVVLARAVEAALSGVDDGDAVRDRVTRQVQEQLTQLAEVLSRGGDNVVTSLTGHGIVVTVSWRGRELTAAELAAGLAGELAERERLLSAKERELLENHLVSDVAARLQELIRAAEFQVASMNRELAERPTSTGMQLRFVWQPRPDAPTGLAQARERLLRQVSDAWSEDDRGAVGAFLQQQIAEVRGRDAGGTWSDHLREALDYRAWHAFAVERRQDGRWRPATGPASGGERVLAATIPLFAAASSHYASAGSPHAPRLVLLDEAFAGVDDDSRAKCLGLLEVFDLDYVLTSEREWGCYPTVPGLAIAQLSRREGIDAVLVTRWEWDGVARRRVEPDLPPMAAPA